MPKKAKTPVRSLRAIRAERTRIQEDIELRQLQYAQQQYEQFRRADEIRSSMLPPIGPNRQSMEESTATWDYWLSAYTDLLDRYRDGGSYLTVPISTTYDRRYGTNYPFQQSEQQLSIYRATSRVLCTMNSYAIGLLTGIQAYIIGDGFTYHAVAKTTFDHSDESAMNEHFSKKLCAKVQDCIDEFVEENFWQEMEQELFWRSREDGEFFERYYVDDSNDCLVVRIIEPEQITQPVAGDVDGGYQWRTWSYGIKTNPDDVWQIFAYFVRWFDAQAHDEDGRPGYMGEEVDASDIYHFKANVKRNIKRGMPDFSFDAQDALELASKLRRNLGEGAAIQAAVAGVREHSSASLAQVSGFQQGLVDFSRPSNLPNNRGVDYARVEPGTFWDMDANTKFVPPPGAENADKHLAVLQGLLRAAGIRWQAPEWLASASAADMAAYTASLEAAAPFRRVAESKQNLYKRAFSRTIKRAVQTKIDRGLLPPDTLRLIDIQCEAPALETQNKLEEAQANSIRVTGGWKSKQTVIQEEGGDVDQEMDNIEQWNERMGQPGNGLGLPPDDPDNPDAGDKNKVVPPNKEAA
jgi:hypothetical protein